MDLPADDERKKLTFSRFFQAAFEEEDGTPLSDCTVRFSDGKNSADYQADQDGTLTIFALPAGGELTASVPDGRKGLRGTVTLGFPGGGD